MTTYETGTLDEALERLHRDGPEFRGWLSNHAPMAVEALVRHGQHARVHRWIDAYRARLEERPPGHERITAADWRAALGDPRRLTDWTDHFEERLREEPWREVLAAWWPRLLPGIAAGATHPVIRVGHAVRVLLTGPETAPRLAELAHGLGYWAARHQPLPAGIAPLPAPAGPEAALRAVPLVGDQSGGINHRLGQIERLPAWAGEVAGVPPEEARDRLAALVRAAARYYAHHAHGEPVMLVHAVTAPNAVLRTLPALPPEQWGESLARAWAASAGVVAAYGPPTGPRPPADPGRADAAEVFARAAEHGDEHVIKLADTVVDVASWDAGDPVPLGGALRAAELVDPDD